METSTAGIILVVDDEPHNLDVLNGCLLEFNYDVLVATNGEQALDRVSLIKPDLILLDVKLPGIDGFEVCRRLKAIDGAKDIPIIFVTVSTDIPDKIKGLEAGATDYITKPFHPREVVARVEKQLFIRDIQRRLEESNLRLREEIDAHRRTEQALREKEARVVASLKEKGVLLREIHHRVKNNLQVVISLLRLQSNAISDPQARVAFGESMDRIRAMAMVHETLCRSDSMAPVSCHKYLDRLVEGIASSHIGGPGALSSEIDDLSIHIDQAVPLGLIVNELVSNAMKHAFPDDRRGQVKVTMSAAGEHAYELTVSDNGVGIPEDLDFDSTDSLGLQLVRTLARTQLQGTLDVVSDNGTCFVIRFKRKSDDEA